MNGYQYPQIPDRRFIQDRDPGDEDNPNYPFRDDTWDEDEDEDWEVASEGCPPPYDLHDPKHPRHYSVHADLWDNRDKTTGMED